MPDWTSISRHVQVVSGLSLQPDTARSVGGGCINTAYQLDSETGKVFIKTNAASKLAMFEAEAEGLREISQSQTIRVPTPLCFGTAGNDAYLVLELISLGGSGLPEQLGEGLAAMHDITQEVNGQPLYGWFRNNTIGSIPQVNDYVDNWAVFWAEHRLNYQLGLARRKGVDARILRQGEKLCEGLASFFADYQPKASLLHGDLWSGNYAYDQEGIPVIFDPAVYYGDREVDLAMTELFGGFPQDFYAAYQSTYPLDPGYPVRKTLYNLYHILNHFNLFGGAYLSQAAGMIDRLLSELT